MHVIEVLVIIFNY